MGLQKQNQTDLPHRVAECAPDPASPAETAHSSTPQYDSTVPRHILRSAHLLDLQQTAGNHVVSRMLAQPASQSVVQRVVVYLEDYGEEIDTTNENDIEEFLKLNDEDLNKKLLALLREKDPDEARRLAPILDPLGNTTQENAQLPTLTNRPDSTAEKSTALKAIGDEAIAAAKAWFPQGAGNQLFNAEAADGEAFARMRITQVVMRQIKALVGLGPDEYLSPRTVTRITKITQGGTCGEFASFMYTYISEHYGDLGLDLDIVTSGSHTWVEVKKGNQHYIVDPWIVAEEKVRSLVEPLTGKKAQLYKRDQDEIEKRKKGVERAEKKDSTADREVEKLEKAIQESIDQEIKRIKNLPVDQRGSEGWPKSNDLGLMD